MYWQLCEDLEFWVHAATGGSTELKNLNPPREQEYTNTHEYVCGPMLYDG